MQRLDLGHCTAELAGPTCRNAGVSSRAEDEVAETLGSTVEVIIITIYYLTGSGLPGIAESGMLPEFIKFGIIRFRFGFG